MKQTISLRPTSSLPQIKRQHLVHASVRVVVTKAAAQPSTNGPTNGNDGRQPGELVTADVLREYKRLLASGLSPEAAESDLQSSEWVPAGPVKRLADELKLLDLKINLVLAFLLVLFLLTDPDKVTNNLAGALFQAVAR